MKLCWLCKNFELDPGEPDYSEVTPGSPSRMGCAAGHWFFGEYYGPYGFRGAYGFEVTSEANFCQAMAMAETCQDFDLADGVNLPEQS